MEFRGGKIFELNFFLILFRIYCGVLGILFFYMGNVVGYFDVWFFILKSSILRSLSKLRKVYGVVNLGCVGIFWGV